jgi:hypothetical protein
MFTVKLCDVAPDGTSNLITKGYLNATHRESHAAPTWIVPGKVYELTVELLACSYRVERGHRIRVAVASADFQHCWPTPKSGVNTIHEGSCLILPIVPPQSPKLPGPDLQPSPFPLPKREEVVAPEYSVTRDLVNESATVSYRARCGTGENRSEFTVSRRNPAQAVVKASYKMEAGSGQMTFVVRTQAVTASDERAFHHVVDAEITINDRPHFQKQWSVSVPRRFC